MSRPSIAQRRLEELTNEHNALNAKLLATLYDTLINFQDHTIKLERPDGTKYKATMNGVIREDTFTKQDTLIPWDVIPASHLLEIYSEIVNQMS